MKNEIILALAEKWEEEAKMDRELPALEEDALRLGGMLEEKQRLAKELRQLVELLG